jgi:AraC-like DNA-binding protein/Flp pilus assembly protein TadD
MVKKLYIIMKKLLFIFTFLCYSFATLVANEQNESMVSKYRYLSLQQLVDTADYYYKESNFGASLICYRLLINQHLEGNLEDQEKIVVAYNRSAIIHYQKGDFRTANELLVKALLLAEKIGYDDYIPRILNNFGNIYFSFRQFDLAKSYYEKALNLTQSPNAVVPVLINLGIIELKNKQLNNSFNLFSKALQMSKKNDSIHLFNVLLGLGELYQMQKNFDSAYVYYKSALDIAIKNNHIRFETEALSTLSKLFLEYNRLDSALFYVEQSNKLGYKNGILDVLAENYLTLSKIEEIRGRKTLAFEHFKTHSKFKDSILNIRQIGDSDQIQRLYDISKSNEEIEQLRVEQKVKENTIYFQRIIHRIVLAILLIVSVILIFVYLQNRRLNSAYQVLFEKNTELIENQQNLSDKFRKKYKKSALTHDKQEELLEKILSFMENTSIICDTEFSVDKLAESVQSNHTYVSQAINTMLKKNFRSLLNEYRIREAQRLFSEPDAAKYTIESVALNVGFKSRSAFRYAFKEITGVSPNFYMKSLQNEE